MSEQKIPRLFSLLRDNFSADVIHHGLRGIERETLRVTPGGCLAQTPHPNALGSALTSPYITTDYSEALLEFVTPPLAGNADTLATLTDIHAFTVQQLDN
ncbi:MAG TPA: glutamate--cysteine ligase, partial [Gammaproteobacteria bacterium]|nr:glutamate--cysteine ligase [Gammaproteobacteria bacterium]